MAKKTKQDNGGTVTADKPDPIKQASMKNYVTMDPNAVKIGVQSRYFDHTDDDVMEKVESYRQDGQLVPVLARKVGKDIEVYDGVCRTLAMRKHNELYPSDPLPLKVIITDVSPDEAFLRSVKANEERKKVSVVDRAFQARRMINDMGMKNKEVAEFFKSQASYVTRIMKLTQLRKSVLKMIHEGDLSFETGCDIAELPEVDQDDIAARAEAYIKEQKEKRDVLLADWIKDAGQMPPPSSNGAAKGDDAIPFGSDAEPAKGGETATTPAAPAAPARNRAQPGGTGRAKPQPTVNQKVQGDIAAKREAAAAASPAGQTTKFKPPTLAKVKKFFEEEFTGPAEKDILKKFAGYALDWMGGKMSDKNFAKKTREIHGEK